MVISRTISLLYDKQKTIIPNLIFIVLNVTVTYTAGVTQCNNTDILGPSQLTSTDLSKSKLFKTL